MQLSDLNVGDKIKFGNLYSSPIVWLVADKNHSGYPANSVTLVSERIIKIMAFDAKEPLNSNSDRQKYGNNRYLHSNIRQWLNSAAADGAWYSAQHAADAPPNSTNTTYNPYDTQAGFLNGFSANFIAAMQSTTLTVGKSSTDGGGTETCVDKMFLLSPTEVGLSGGFTEGSKLALFSDNNSRLANPTAEAVTNSTYTDASLNTGAAWYWWLRSPHASYANYVRYVTSDGALNFSYAYGGSYGLRPACNLSGDTGISETVDIDGCYTLVWSTPINLSVKVDGELKTYDKGWVKVDGELREIEKIWVKIDGVLRSV